MSGGASVERSAGASEVGGGRWGGEVARVAFSAGDGTPARLSEVTAAERRVSPEVREHRGHLRTEWAEGGDSGPARASLRTEGLRGPHLGVLGGGCAPGAGREGGS